MSDDDKKRAIATATRLCATAELLLRAASHQTQGGAVEDELLTYIADDLQRQAELLRNAHDIDDEDDDDD